LLVPQAERIHLRKMVQALPVTARARDRSLAAFLLGHPDRPRRDHDRGDQATDIPVHGAGSVSSKSLISKMMLRSGVAKPPKFTRWQSPQDCTRRSVVNVPARSAAITPAAPR